MTNYKVMPSEIEHNGKKWKLVAGEYGCVSDIGLTLRVYQSELAPSIECEDVARVQHDMSVEWNPSLTEDLPAGTKLFTYQPDAQAKIADLEAKLKFTDDLKLGELKRINVQLTGKVEELEAWKAEALLVESEWDVQAVGKALNIPLGKSIRAEILPKIRELEADRKNLIVALVDLNVWIDGLPVPTKGATAKGKMIDALLAKMKKGE